MAVLFLDLDVEMGSVRATLTISNNIDKARADAGEIAASDVRSFTTTDVVVDTGATYLGLPPDVIAQLGLRQRRTLPIRTANGVIQARLFSDAELTVMGRTTTLDVLELPAGTPILLGVTPMEILGLEPDLQNRRLRALPLGPDDTYVMAV
jgi:predicted aspartyl protease